MLTCVTQQIEWKRIYVCTGFPIKGARFSKLKNILFLLSDEKEVKIIENIDFKYFSNRASFMESPVSRETNNSWVTVCAF